MKWNGSGARDVFISLIQALRLIMAKFGMKDMLSDGLVVSVRMPFPAIKRKTNMDILGIVKPIYDKWAAIDKKDELNTYCNLFINEIMVSQGYHQFAGRVANSIIDTMEKYDKFHWDKIDPAEWAQDTIVIAGRQDDPHGHVNILIPGEYVVSPKWHDKKVPLCANVGKDCFWGKGVNWAFGKDEPIYYRFRS